MSAAVNAADAYTQPYKDVLQMIQLTAVSKYNFERVHEISAGFPFKLCHCLTWNAYM